MHAFHFSPQPWNDTLVAEALKAMSLALAPDFLVFPVPPLGDRQETFRFLGTLELLLETLAGRGVKVALQPSQGQGGALATLMKEVRGEAVGYCWTPALEGEMESLADRLFTARGQAEGQYTALQRLGYRWNMAVPFDDPGEAQRHLAALEASHPMVYFPEIQS